MVNHAFALWNSINISVLQHFNAKWENYRSGKVGLSTKILRQRIKITYTRFYVNVFIIPLKISVIIAVGDMFSSNFLFFEAQKFFKSFLEGFTFCLRKSAFHSHFISIFAMFRLFPHTFRAPWNYRTHFYRVL